MTPYMKQMFAVNGAKEGDVFGFSGKGFISDVINIGTYGLPRWGLSHIGIISSWRGRRYLFESTTLNGGKRDAITGKPVSGVQAHRLEDILARPGKVWRYPLVDPLTSRQKRRLSKDMMEHLGQPYDYVGAARSGGFLLRLFEKCVRQEDLDTLFCSELVAHTLTDLGIAEYTNASSQSPNSLARDLVKTGLCWKRKRIK